MTMMVDSGLAGSLTPAASGGSTTGAAPAPTGIAALFSALMSSVASPAAIPGASGQPATVPPSAESPAIVPGSSEDGATLAPGPAPASAETPMLAAEITTYLDQLIKSIEPKKPAVIPAAKVGPAPSTAEMEAAVCDGDSSDTSIEAAPSLPDDLASATVAMSPAPIAAPFVPLETLRAAPLAAAPKDGAVREATAKPTAAPAPAPVMAAVTADAEAPPSSIDLAAVVDAFVQQQNGSSRTAKPTPVKAIASDRSLGPVASPKVKADTALTDSAPALSLSAASAPQQAPVAAVGTSTPGVATAFPAAIPAAIPPAMSSANDIGAMLGEQVIDMGSGGQWIDGLAREIAALGKGEGQGSFRLSPEHLGPMRVDIRAGDQGANVTLTVETKAAEAMLVQDRHLLKTDAQLSALRIGDVTVERVAHVADVGRSDTATGQGTSGQPGGQGQAAQNAAFAQSQSQNQSNSAAHRKDSDAASVSSEAEPRTPGDSAPSDNARRARYA